LEPEHKPASYLRNSIVVKKNSVAIIGSGIAGLASAIRLAVAGFDVKVFEANSYPGGKLSAFESNGYKFDAGPSLFTLPALVDELFLLAGKTPSDYFLYRKLPETCRYFWEDNTRITAWADLPKFAQEVESNTQVPKEKVTQFLSDAAWKYKTVGDLFLDRSLHQLSTWTNPTALRAYLKIPFLGLFGTMHKANESYFQHPKMVQLFDRYATYNGSNPYQTPALLNIIPHLEHNVGAYLPVGGMHAITQSLHKLAIELGVQFHFNAKVEKVLFEGNKVMGLLVNRQQITVQEVVCNMDMVNAYKSILKEAPQPKRLLRQPKSSSALIFYWGIKQTFPELGLHNILFSHNYRAEFEHIFAKKTVFEDPTVYINITSKYEELDAPTSCENWFVMVNVPSHDGQDWDNIIAKTRRQVVLKINRMLGVDLEPLIESEELLEPRTIELKTSSSGGALYGNSSNNRFAAFLRHPNFSPNFSNLWFCGGSVHPGGGIPLALSSAKITTDMMLGKRKN